ncbi:MAG: hypothetical protein ABI871_08170 [Chthoniobacterales bacterium]
MDLKFWKGLLLVIASLLTTRFTHAGNAATLDLAADANFQAFLAAYISAVNSRNIAKLAELAHPKCLVVVTPQNKDFYDYWFTKETRRNIPPDCKLTVTVIPADGALPFENIVSYPIRPTHQIQLDFDYAPNKSVSVIRQLVHEGDKWYEVIPAKKAP